MSLDQTKQQLAVMQRIVAVLVHRLNCEQTISAEDMRKAEELGIDMKHEGDVIAFRPKQPGIQVVSRISGLH